MNIVQKQQHIENFYLEAFLKRMGIKADNIKRGEDPPDFYITLDSSNIAIEATEYHSKRKGPTGNSWRAIEEEWWKIRNLFTQEREKYPQLNDVYGTLYFKQLNMPSSKEHEQFVFEMLDFGASKHENLTEKRDRFESFAPNYPLLDKYLQKIYLQKAGCYMTWDRNSATHIGISEKELEVCVSKKLQITRPEKITENWLLIVTGSNMSQQIGLTHYDKFNRFINLNESLAGSPYDKVFFFQYVWQRILCWSNGGQWEEVKVPVFAKKRESHEQ